MDVFTSGLDILPVRMTKPTSGDAVPVPVPFCRGVRYASFNPAPRLPRNSAPLAVSVKAKLARLAVGPT